MGYGEKIGSNIPDISESALLRVTLLDLRAAFVTVDHNILILRLKQSVGIEGKEKLSDL